MTPDRPVACETSSAVAAVVANRPDGSTRKAVSYPFRQVHLLQSRRRLRPLPPLQAPLPRPHPPKARRSETALRCMRFGCLTYPVGWGLEGKVRRATRAGRSSRKSWSTPKAIRWVEEVLEVPVTPSAVRGGSV